MDAFYALAEPRRRRIIELLARHGQLPATDIYKKFDVTPQAISQHLKVLLGANLLHMEKRSQQHIYQINTKSMREMEEWLEKYGNMWNQRFDALERVLKEENDKKR